MKTFEDIMTINVGDEVLARIFDRIGKVEDISQKNGETLYTVSFTDPIIGLDGKKRKITEFGRYGITKNYDQKGREQVGNVVYYAEELQGDWYGHSIDIHGMEIFRPTENRPTFVVIADPLSQPQEMTLKEVSKELARCYHQKMDAAENLKQQYDNYVQGHIMEPNFAEVTIMWKDSGEKCEGYVIALNDVPKAFPEEDEKVFFYMESVDDLINATSEDPDINGEDFIILPDSVSFFEKL